MARPIYEQRLPATAEMVALLPDYLDPSGVQVSNKAGMGVDIFVTRYQGDQYMVEFFPPNHGDVIREWPLAWPDVVARVMAFKLQYGC